MTADEKLWPSRHANRDYERIAREILDEAGRVDAGQDERFGDRRGDELPPELSTAQAHCDASRHLGWAAQHILRATGGPRTRSATPA